MSSVPNEVIKEIYLHTLNQRSTMFRFYLAVLGFYFAGVFLVFDKAFTKNSSCNSYLFLMALIISGVIVARISNKFQQSAEWAHDFISKMREENDFHYNSKQNIGSYHETFQFVYRLGRVVGASLSFSSITFLTYSIFYKVWPSTLISWLCYLFLISMIFLIMYAIHNRSLVNLIKKTESNRYFNRVKKYKLWETMFYFFIE